VSTSSAWIGKLTGNTREELPGERLNVRARERSKVVGLQEVKHALPVEVRDDAYVVAKVEALPQMNAFIPVVPVVLGERGEHA
jgi:hypothetical protein